ncbi:uncharacterized protein LOC127701221 isoform X7 [Mytilus californianus]|uniref:uncharacterized protein LOC127701221 isoform X7 n=1 Tax=Mytilus californianus TaxID=6549 RepID=UPI0022468297|nr:uncharacterized protein LOC127701221 isoform X7 [Mytilus californianus]
MAVPFSNTKLRVPKGFQNVLEGLAREVLRNQPDNIYEFGAKYFEQMLAVRDETGHDPAVHGARLEDRFYNNDSFKSPVVDSGDPQQQDAALKIQTEFRRHDAVKKVETMQEEEAALTIQSSFRGHQDREKVKQMIVEKDPTQPKGEEEEVDIDLTDPDVEQAAIKIQAGFKGFKARKEVQTKAKSKEPEVKEQTELDKAATKIQAGFRGHQARQHHKKPKEKQPESKEEEVDIDLNDPEVEKAATKIQAGFRGHKTRKEMQSKTDVQKSETEVKTEEKKEEKQEEEVDIDLNDPETANAALKIQAGFRGYKTRKELQGQVEEGKTKESESNTESKEETKTDSKEEGTKTDSKEEGTKTDSKEEETKTDSKEEEVDIDLNDPEVEKAATKIQAGFKGYKTRKEMQEKKSDTSVEKKEEEKTEEGEKKTEELRITLNPNQASKMLEVLSAFPSFKTPKDLPDHLRLSKYHLKRLKKWRKLALENKEKPTFAGSTKLTAGAFRLFQDNQVLSTDKESDDIKEEEDEEDSLFGDLSDEDEDEDQNTLGDLGSGFKQLSKGMGNVFGNMLGPIGTTASEPEKDGENRPQGLVPLMTGMTGMINKNLMYEPYKASRDALDEWIQENRGAIENKDIKTREKQLEIITQIVAMYEEEKEDEDPEITKTRNMKIMELVTESEKLGELPQEVQAKSAEFYQEGDHTHMLEGMTEALTSTMESMFTGLGEAMTGGKDGDGDACTIL